LRHSSGTGNLNRAAGPALLPVTTGRVAVTPLFCRSLESLSVPHIKHKGDNGKNLLSEPKMTQHLELRNSRSLSRVTLLQQSLHVQLLANRAALQQKQISSYSEALLNARPAAKNTSALHNYPGDVQALALPSIKEQRTTWVQNSYAFSRNLRFNPKPFRDKQSLQGYRVDASLVKGSDLGHCAIVLWRCLFLRITHSAKACGGRNSRREATEKRDYANRSDGAIAL